MPPAEGRVRREAAESRGCSSSRSSATTRRGQRRTTRTARRPQRQLRNDDEHALLRRHRRLTGTVPASHPAQPGHHHHHQPSRRSPCCCSSSTSSAARSTPGGVQYVNYLLPGILLITVASGIAYTASGSSPDMSGGIFERFQSMPIARSAVLWAHVLTSLVANLSRSRSSCSSPSRWASAHAAGVLAWLAVAGILDRCSPWP